MPVAKITVVAVALAATASLVLINRGSVPSRDKSDTAVPNVAKEEVAYFSPAEIPDSIELLPPPPAAGSPALELDEQARRKALTLRGSPRYVLAAQDAVRLQPNTVRAFQCALGTEISTEGTPTLYKLLARVRLEVRTSSYKAKSYYRRPRPFVVHNAKTCYEPDESMVHNDGSYPSARAAVGWAYGLVLAKLRPERTESILNRAREFGQSRVVCDLEWQSDVDAGRILAAVVVAKMDSDRSFRADLDGARKEVSVHLASGVKPAANCEAERVSLASR